MIAAFQLNLFNTSAIEGEITQNEPVCHEKDGIGDLIVTAKSLAVRAAAKLVPYFHNRQAIPKSSASRCANKTLSRIMTEVAGSTDAEGVWIWKDAYDAVEAALVMFIQQEGNSLISQQGALKAIEQIHWLCPTHTRRSEEAIALQQFSTPLAMAYVASVAAQITASDIVLEPSAGTGLLAVWAEIQGARLILNEIAPRRREILTAVFPKATVSGHNAEQIDDYLDATLLPTAIIMNPPFSASPKMAKRNQFATWKHITSALARLQPAGRLVTITANWFSPLNPDWRDYFVRLQKVGRVAFSAGITGQAYAKHGTLIETRLTVIDKVPADNPVRD